MKKITIQSNNKNITIQEAFEKFMKFQKAKNISEQSVTYYKRCLKYFEGFYQLDNDCNTIDADLFIDYSNYLQSLGTLKPVTVNTNLRGLRTMLYYWMEMGYITKRFKVRLLTVDEEVKETYTDYELLRLLEKPNLKTCSFAEYRTWVMTVFFMGTGARIGSTLEIKISDLDLEEKVCLLKVVKNRKQQYLYLTDSLTQILKEYLAYRGGESSDYLFCTQFGGKLSRRGAQDCIADYNKKRGVDKTSAHLYRHTFAKKWIMSKGDTTSLMSVLGHKSLQMTNHYAQLWGTDIKSKNEMYNPLEQFQTTTVGKKTLTLKKNK